MFGFNKNRAEQTRGLAVAETHWAAETADILAPPTPSTIKMSEEENSSLLEWLALSKELGITQRAPALHELRLFCIEEGIPVFNTQKVWSYLREQSQTWGFFPLREVDCEWNKVNTPEEVVLHADIESWEQKEGGTGRQYEEIVPIPVLLTVKKLVARFGNEVHFLIAATRNDPFLAVVLRDSSILFVERWDEPSFRG